MSVLYDVNAYMCLYCLNGGREFIAIDCITVVFVAGMAH